MSKRERFLVRHRTKVRIAGYSLAVFVVLNALLGIGYHNRMYPRTTVLGVAVGNASYKDAQAKLQRGNALPGTITITYQDRKAKPKTTNLGVYIDPQKLSSVANKSRNWIPIFNLLTGHVLDAPVRIDSRTFAQGVSDLEPTFHRDPQPAHIAWSNNQFKAVQAQAGYQLDKQSLQAALLTGMSRKQTVTAPVTAIPPEAKLRDPAKALKAVQAQLNTPVTFHFNDTSIKATPQEIASWYVQSGDNFVLSEAALRESITQTGAKLGIAPQNLDQAVATTIGALKSAKAADVKLFARVKNYHYCLGLRGVGSGNFSELEKRVTATYSDARGWSLEGQVIFKQVSSGCDYTVWLAAADQMSSFGAICDAQWSCTINNNVVINFDRWENATASWNAARAGSLDEYRAMAINHESGHQFGFGHTVCPGAGQPAPVMEQQSIDLQGCKFNAWPTANERSMLRSQLGL